MAESRKWVEGETINSLSAKLACLTDAQAQVAVAEYKGKWIQATGTVVDVSVRADGGLVSILFKPLGASLHFDPDCSQRLLSLNKGDLITTQGEIDSGISFGLSLSHCEIISVTPKASLVEESRVSGEEIAPTISEESETDEPGRVRHIATAEMRRFAKLYLEIWGDAAKEIPAWHAMKACYPNGIIGRDPFLKEFRELRGPGKRGNPAIRGQ